MSYLTLALIILSVVAWGGMFLIAYRESLTRWFINRYGWRQSPLMKEPSDGGKEHYRALPFQYDDTSAGKENQG